MTRRSLRSSVPTRHTTGIERPRCVDRLPSHISKIVVSTVIVGGADWPESRTEAHWPVTPFDGLGMLCVIVGPFPALSALSLARDTGQLSDSDDFDGGRLGRMRANR